MTISNTVQINRATKVEVVVGSHRVSYKRKHGRPRSHRRTWTRRRVTVRDRHFA